MNEKSNCESCMYYAYDDAYKSYFCQMNLDEDELSRFSTYKEYRCPYFRFGDEYSIVRKQM